MNIKRIGGIGIVAVICLLLMIIDFGCNKVEKEEVIKIGGIYSLTGKVASYGKWVKNGIDLAVEQINGSGGINGRKVEIIEEDTQSESKFAVSALEKTISIHKVPVVIGFISSSEFLACAPIAEKSKTVLITPVASAPLERPEGSYVFRTRESGPPQSKKVAEYIHNSLNIKNASVIYENAANAVAYKDAFVESYEALGGKIDQILSYEEGQTDYRAVLTKLKAQPVEAVYLPGVGKIVGRILKQAKELGIRTKFLSSAGIEDPELFNVAGEAANGVIFGAPEFSLDTQTEPCRSFIDAYRKRFGEEPSVYSANAYDALMVVAAAVRNDLVTGNGIKNYLHSAQKYQGVSGTLSFDKFGEVSKPVVLKKVELQRFIVLKEEANTFDTSDTKNGGLK